MNKAYLIHWLFFSEALSILNESQLLQPVSSHEDISKHLHNYVFIFF